MEGDGEWWDGVEGVCGVGRDGVEWVRMVEGTGSYLSRDALSKHSAHLKRFDQPPRSTRTTDI